MLHNLPKLNLPYYSFKVKTNKQSTQIFDTIRKKFIELTPEEWVRQHFIRFLIEEKKYPSSYFFVEKALKVNQLNKRTDIVVYDVKTKSVVLLVECKAPNINITQDTFVQVANYNSAKKSKYLVVTNGIQHFCCEINYSNNSFNFLQDIPEFVCV